MGRLDTDCPIWDRIIDLWVCCGNYSDKSCWNEFGRWITPFRRRIGHWLTDVTPLVPLLTSSKCNFSMEDGKPTSPWISTLSLHLTKNQKESAYKSLPLFQGGAFDKNYNKNYKPIYFDLPAETSKVQIEAVISGHGSDSNSCGEFCPSSHHFVVNGHPHVVTFSTAGSPTGCADRVDEGVVPNEHGTWLYGRGGWCDGLQVSPWLFDVTSELKATNNSVIYFGWLNGQTPDPLPNGGAYIIMYSHLIFYKQDN